MLDRSENYAKTEVEMDPGENLRTEARLAAIAAKVGAASSPSDVNKSTHSEERNGNLPDLTISEGSDPQNTGADEAKVGNGGKAGDDSNGGGDGGPLDDKNGGGEGGRLDEMF